MKESVVKSIENVHQGKRSSAYVLGDHTTSFVVPMKKAIKEIKEELIRAKNVVVHGMTLRGENEGDDRIDKIEDNNMLDEVVKVTNPGSTTKLKSMISRS